MQPHLVRWEKEYRERGLTILYVDNGAIDDRATVEEEVEEGGLTFPVAWDEAGATCAAYGVKVYPTAVLVGRDGSTVWKGVPLPPEDSEKRIRAALGLPPKG